MIGTIRQKIEANVGTLTDIEFREVGRMTAADIKYNRIFFGQRTSLERCVFIATMCLKAYRFAKRKAPKKEEKVLQ